MYTKFERNWLPGWVSPTYQLVFSHQCNVKDKELKSVAPEELVIEDFESRMGWILKAGDMFHKLMKTHKNYMESELATMAAWDSAPDAAIVY